jgi:signal transduction histidine kinase
LTRSELISKADAICADSKETYKGVYSRTSEETPDVAYSQVLVGISTRAMGRLEALDPPPALAREYDEYLRTQERVRNYDRQALEAAKAGDSSAYLEARGKRDAEEPERERLAREIGFEVCGIPGA